MTLSTQTHLHKHTRPETNGLTSKCSAVLLVSDARMASTNFRLVAVADILLLHINDPFHINQTHLHKHTKPETNGLASKCSAVLLVSDAKMASTNFRLVAVADILLLHINDPFHTNQTHLHKHTKPETNGLASQNTLVLYCL